MRTIKAHRHAVMEKLGVKSFAQAVSIAERWGCLPSRAAQLQAPAGECSSNPIGPRYNIFLDPYVPTVEPSAGIRRFDFYFLYRAGTRKMASEPLVVTVVDDNPAFLKSLTRLLRVHGFSLRSVWVGQKRYSTATKKRGLRHVFCSISIAQGFRAFEAGGSGSQAAVLPVLRLSS